MAKNKYGSKTHTGNVRDHNEDSIRVDEKNALWIVADGMGGHDSGEVASAIACDIINKQVADGAGLTTAIQAAHHEIISAGQSGVGSVGMGTTVVALQAHENDFDIAWVGDSRIYLWDGQLRQVSKDHSLVQKLLDSGVITEAAARSHPDSNLIYQCLGSLEVDDVEVDHISGQFFRHQKILLCSDGLSDEVEDKDIAEILANGGSEQEICERLVQAALDNRGRDNISVILVSAPEDAPEKVEAGDTQPMKTQSFAAPGKSSGVWGVISLLLIIIVVALAVFLFNKA